MVDSGGVAFSVETVIGDVYTIVTYGVAMIGRLLKIIGLFCKGDLQKRPGFCEETCNFKEPTNQ